MALVNDLLAIIATYATQSVTFTLLSMDVFLVDRLYRTDLWYHKVLYENKGLHVASNIISGKWFNNYRLVNRTYNGDLGIVSYPYDSKDITIISWRAVHGIQYRTSRGMRIMIQDDSGTVNVYNDQVALISTYGSLPYFRTISNYKTDQRIYCSDERGRVYDYWYGYSDEPPQIRLIYDNANDPVVMVSYDYQLRRSGRIDYINAPLDCYVTISARYGININGDEFELPDHDGTSSHAVIGYAGIYAVNSNLRLTPRWPNTLSDIGYVYLTTVDVNSPAHEYVSIERNGDTVFFRCNNSGCTSDPIPISNIQYIHQDDIYPANFLFIN